MNLVHIQSMYDDADAPIFMWVLTGDGLLFLGSDEYIHVYKGFEFMYSIWFELAGVSIANKNIIYVSGRFYFLQCNRYAYYLVIMNLDGQLIKRIKLKTIQFPWISKIHHYNKILYIMIDKTLQSYDLDGNAIQSIPDVSYGIYDIHNGMIYDIDYITTSPIYHLHMFDLSGKRIKRIEIPTYTCSAFYNDLLHLGGIKKSISIVEKNHTIRQINFADNEFTYISNHDGEPMVRIVNRTTHLYEFKSMLIKVDNYKDVSILNDYIIIATLEIPLNSEVVKAFEYYGRLYIATTAGFYIYSEYYPHLREQLPPAQKLKTKNWMKLLGSRPVIQKDLHFLFECELLK